MSGGIDILVTTCRHATPPVRRLAREIAWSLGFAKRVNRGRMSFAEVTELAKTWGAKRVIVVGRGLHGNPGLVLFVSTAEGEEGRLVLSLRLRGVVFSGLKRRPPKPEVKPPVVSISTEDELAEVLALALNTIYLGAYTLEDLKMFSTFKRVVALEPVRQKGFIGVIKFLEEGGEIGPKLLVRSFSRAGVQLV